MKKILSTLAVLCISTFAFAQTNTFPTSGSVGIGTLSPNSILEVKSTGVGNQLRIWDHSWPDDSYVGFGIYGVAQTAELASFGYRYHIDGSSNSGIQFGTSSSAFMTLLTNGRLGIGTDSPDYLLDLEGSLPIMRLNSWASNPELLLSKNGTVNGKLSGGANSLYLFGGSDGTPDMTIDQNGKVGIGRTNPNYKLHVAGDMRASGTMTVEKNGNYRVSLNGQTDGYLIARNDLNEDKFALRTNGVSFLNGGNVGIGTTSPTEKLEVNGTVRSKKVKVSATGWPDYVFSDNYELRDIKALEAFIKTNKHLPEVPSAKEVESNGLDLGSMDATLLKKVEELTLYTIAQEKQIKKQAQENDELRVMLLELRKEIEQLKKDK